MESNKELDWWNSKTLEEQLYLAIEGNHYLDGDTVDNHPNNLKEEDIKLLWEYHCDFTTIVRSNILEDKGYVPYCIPCPGLQRYRSNGVGKQMTCPNCKTETKFPQSFLDEWVRVHNSKKLNS